MADYQLTVLGAQERLQAPQTTNEQEGRHEQSALFAFPETMPGQMDLGGPIRDLDAWCEEVVPDA